MKQLKIRLGVFETNSSSTHSLTTIRNFEEVGSLIVDEVFDDDTNDFDRVDANKKILYLNLLEAANGEESSFSIVIVDTPWARASYIFMKVAAMVAAMNVTPIKSTFRAYDNSEVPVYDMSYKAIIKWLKSDDPTAKSIWDTLNSIITQIAQESYNCDKWSLNKIDDSNLAEDVFYDESFSSENGWILDNYKDKIKDALNYDKKIVSIDHPYHNYNGTYTIKRY